jgi:type II secretory pathway pseudopilin PulG
MPGRGLRSAESGISLVELMIAVTVIAIILAAALPSYLGAMRTARETAAIELMRQFASAQQLYYATNRSFTDEISELVEDGYFQTSLNDQGVGYGYRFALMKGAGKGGKKKKRKQIFVEWSATAQPEPLDSKARYFYIDQTGLIRYEVGKDATQQSKPLGQK